MPEQDISTASTDPFMRRFREAAAAVIALTIVVGTIVMMIIALDYVNSPELDPSEKFARVKDLLLFINPLVGVVIGYYFNKVTSEARAETAESAAQGAIANAQQATEARNTAEADAKAARSETQETKATLSEVCQAVEKAMPQMQAPKPGTLSGEGKPTEDMRPELQALLARARRLMK